MGEFVNVSSENRSVLSLDDYGSDEALAAVELFVGYPDALLTFASVCCYLFMAVGIPGNLITIVALARYEKVRNATAIFIISLSFSDLLFCCFVLPLAGSMFWNQSWPHGRLLCKLFPMARYGLIAVSILTVLAITLNRYIMIAYPRVYQKLYTKKKITLMIGTLWLFCFGILIPIWLGEWGQFSLDIKTGSCTIVQDEDKHSPKKFLFVSAFLIPGVLILFCYARIFFIVKKISKRSRTTPRVRPNTVIVSGTSTDLNTTSLPTKAKHISLPLKRNPFACLAIPEISTTSIDSSVEHRERKMTDSNKFFSRSSETIQKLRVAFKTDPKPREKVGPSRKDRKLRTMIMAIMLSFVLCHLPISTIKVFLEVSAYPVFNILSYVTLYLTTCINPIIYVVMSIEYRQAYKSLMTCQRGDQAYPEAFPDTSRRSVLRRITSMKALKSFRRSRTNRTSV